MSYQIFARKFRPRNFEEVVGQDPITRTLQNAIDQERIPQSFLFSGPRGVGKTSTARILAKCLNCEKGPALKPCDKCASCKEITASNSMDVLEIDGASNRGIDEIRNLRETVKFKPTQGRYKIYIIDEVHMLTTEAFNALLKTLEEPPLHVKFIFATTEAHKVPLTILSRCQRFNFKRITVAETVTKLEEIAKKEKIQFEPKALFLIAKAGEGALRDAEGLLDQLATFSPEKIKEEDVLFMLGLASESIYFEILEALKSNKADELFLKVRDLYDNGTDMVHFAKGLLDMFRHLLLYQVSENPAVFLEWSESSGKDFEEKKNLFTRGELLLAVSLLQNLQNQLRRNVAPPKLLVETALMKLMHLEGLRPIDEAIGQISPAAAEPSAPLRMVSPVISGPAKGVKKQTPAGGDFEATSHKVKDSASAQGMKESSLQAESQGGVALSVNEAESFWPRVIEYVKGKRMSLGIFLSESEPVEIQDHKVVLGLPAELQFHKETLEKEASRQLIEEAFEVVSGRKIHVQFVITQAVREESPADESEETREVSSAPASGKLPDIIMDAMNIFNGAKIIRKE